MNKTLVCPIAFNEHIKLQSAITRFIQSPVYGLVDYCVIDDGSTDETPAMIEKFRLQSVQTIRHEKQRGVGAGIRTAIHHAQKNGYEILVIMAGNDKDDPNEIARLVAPVVSENFDFVQGSRYLKTGKVGGDMPLYRKFATRLHPLLLTLMTGKKITDSTNGFRAIKLSLFNDKRIDIDQPWLDHYELEPYIFFKALTLGCQFKEVPVTKIYPPKKLGYTKMKPILGWWSILKPLFYLWLGIKK